MSRRKISTTVYLEAHQLEVLQALSNHRKVPMSVLIREGIDRILHDSRAGELGIGLPQSSASAAK